MRARLRGEATATAIAENVEQVFDGYADNIDIHPVGAFSNVTLALLHELVSLHVATVTNSLHIIDLRMRCGPVCDARVLTQSGNHDAGSG